MSEAESEDFSIERVTYFCPSCKRVVSAPPGMVMYCSFCDKQMIERRE